MGVERPRAAGRLPLVLVLVVVEAELVAVDHLLGLVAHEPAQGRELADPVRLVVLRGQVAEHIGVADGDVRISRDDAFPRHASPSIAALRHPLVSSTVVLMIIAAA